MSTVMTAVMCYLYNELEFLQTGRSFMEEWSRFRSVKERNRVLTRLKNQQREGLQEAVVECGKRQRTLPRSCIILHLGFL